MIGINQNIKDVIKQLKYSMKRTALITIFPIVLLLILVSNQNVSSSPVSSNADLIIYPEHDTYTSDLEDINGLRDYISIRKGGEGLLKFPIEQIISADIVYLEMRNYVNDVCTITVYGVDNDVWDEYSLKTQKDVPKTTDVLDRVSIIGEGWYKWDVTSFVNSQEDGWVTLRLENEDDTGHFQGKSKDDNSEEYWPFLSVNGAVHTEDVPQLPIYSIITTTVYTSTEEVDANFIMAIFSIIISTIIGCTRKKVWN